MILKVLICILAFLACLTFLISGFTFADGDLGVAATLFTITILSVIAVIFMITQLIDGNGNIAFYIIENLKLC